MFSVAREEDLFRGGALRSPALSELCHVIRVVAQLTPTPPPPHYARCFSPYRTLFQSEGTALRFTNMIEVMAPVYEMEFFDELIRPTLYRAHFGWLLDFLWPWLLGYPADKFAVVDTVCMYHPHGNRAAPDSLYKKGARGAAWRAVERGLGA